MTLAAVKNGYLRNTARFVAACDGITEDEAKFRPYDKTNSLIWHLGHLNFYRNTIIKLLNPTEVLEVMPNEQATFGYGSQPTDASLTYPTIAELLASIEKRGLRIGELIDVVTPEHLDSESPMKISTMGPRVGDLVFGFLIHEANHFGELNVNKHLIVRLRS
jgi:DinB superfamily